jgi:WD40 repeat protein
MLATPGGEGEAMVWNLADHGRLLARTVVAGGGYADAFGFSPDSRLLGMTFVRGTTGYLWDMKPEHPPLAFNGLSGWVFRFSKDGSTIYANSAKTLTLWDAASGKERGGLLGRWGGINTMDDSPDGKTLAFPAKGAVRLWNIATRREVGRFELPDKSDRVAFAPDGSALLILQNRTNGPVTLIKRAPSFEQTDPRP